MKKFKVLFLLVICLFVQLASSAEMLKGEIEKVWTVDSAREEAFKDLKPEIDLSWAPPIDPNLIENKQAINNQQKKVDNRIITPFSDGGYGVWILDDDNYDKVYYYSQSGELITIDFCIFSSKIHDLESYESAQQNGETFPFKTYKHAYPGGKIVNVAITVKNKDNFMFKPSGALQFHWLGNTCYDAHGKIILTRND